MAHSFLFYSFACIIMLVVLLSILQHEKFTNDIPEYLHHKTKCFDCEKQVIATNGEAAVWAAQPSKLFSAEQEGIIQAGGDISGGFMGKTLKYY